MILSVVHITSYCIRFFFVLVAEINRIWLDITFSFKKSASITMM